MQRKQSLWLFLAAVSILLAFVLPYGMQATSGVNTTQVENHDLTAKSNWLLALLTGMCAAVALVTIFLHQNRSMQKKLCWLVLLFAIACGAYMLYDANKITEGKKLAIGLVQSSLYLGMLLPVLTAGLAIMAFTGIRKDEKLIQSMDRLR